MDAVLSRPVMPVKSIVPIAGPLWLLSLVMVNVPRNGPKITPGNSAMFLGESTVPAYVPLTASFEYASHAESEGHNAKVPANVPLPG